MRSLSDKAGILVVANLFKYSVGFVVPIVLVRLLSQHDYGTYQQLSLLSTATAGIMTLGLPTSVYYFYHHVPASRHSVLALQTGLMLACAGLVAGAFLHLAAPFLALRMSNPDLATLLGRYAIYVVFFIASEHFIHFLISQNRYRLAVGIEAGETVVRVAFLFVPLILGYGLVGLVWAMVMYVGMRFGLRTYILLSGINVRSLARSGSMFPREQLRYSIPLALSSVVGLVGGLLDKAIIASYFTPAHYAIYAVGALEIPLDVIFQASVANVLRTSFPPLVRDGNMAELVKIWREAVRKLATIILPSFVFLLGFSHDFITLLFTNKYAESVNVFRIYLFLMPAHIFIFSLIPQVFGKTKLNLYIAMSTIAINLGLSFVLLRMVGFYGPAMATVSMAFLSSGIYLVVTTRLIGVSAWRLLPLSSLLKIISVAGLALGTAYLARNLVDGKWLVFLTCAAVYSAAFLVMAVLTGVFTREDKKLVWRWTAKILGLRAG